MISIILPAHNEERRLAKCVERVDETCRSAFHDYEIIISEDGSRDATYDVAKRIASENPHIRIFHEPQRLGRGGALNHALKQAKGSIAVYMDVDLSSNLRHLKELIECIHNGAAIATGSRLAPGSSRRRGIVRDIASLSFNLLVRTLLNSRLHDHQCGFKAFHLPTILPWLDEVEDRHWFWDTELLVRAQRKGLRVDEIPVEWEQHAPDSTVRLRADVLYMGRKILHLRKKLREQGL